MLEVLKLSSYSTPLSTKFNLLINVKLPTIVVILTFISMINTTSERPKARNFLICLYFSFYEQFSCTVELSMKKVYNIRSWCKYIMLQSQFFNATNLNLNAIREKKISRKYLNLQYTNGTLIAIDDSNTSITKVLPQNLI